MPVLYVSADSLTPANHAIEAAYSYGGTAPYGPPVKIDTGNGQQLSMIPATNTRMVFGFGSDIYKLLNRQQVFASPMMQSADGGDTWSELDSTHTPLFETCAGYFDEDSGIVYCAYVTANGTGGGIRLRNFNLNTGLWGSIYGVAGAPTAAQSSSIGVWLRPDNTLLIVYQNRNSFDPGDPSGIGGAVYDVTGGSWTTTFDIGDNITTLPGWDETQTVCRVSRVTSTMDDTGIVHVFFVTSSIQTVPVVWGNRVFYQAVNLDNSLGAFFDFPGQTAPFPAPPYNKQQLEAFSGAPYGTPVIVNDSILLPVSVRNDSTDDRFPLQIPSLYIGTPVSAPVWTLDPDTIDPGVLVDDFIWIQQAPALVFDGTTLTAVYSAQDEDGQNLARLRMTQTTNTADPTADWSASTIFDLQVDAPPGFNFSTQFVSGLGVFTPFTSPPPGPVIGIIDVMQCCMIPLPNPVTCS